MLWFAVRFLVVTAGFAAVHGYLWLRLFRDTAERGSRWRSGGGIALGVLGAFGLAAWFAVPSQLPLAGQQIIGWPGWIWFGACIYLVGLLVVAEPVRWWLLRRERGAPEPEADPRGPTRRQIVSRGIGAGVGALAAAATGYGLAESYRTPRIKEVSVPIAGLGRAHDGYRITVVGDTHFSALRGSGYCRRVVDRINRTQPDLIAFVGDLASGEVDHLRAATEPLSGLRAREGAYFVAGNAEHYVGADQWYERIEELGMTGLPNTRVELPAFDLAGVNDLIAAQRGFEDETGPDLDAALGDRDPSRPVVLLAHQPDVIVPAQDFGIDLQLSGHTHGGQMWPLHIASGLRSVQLDGLERWGEAWLYVTNGAGTNGPPLRLGADAEIAVVTLRAGRA